VRVHGRIVHLSEFEQGGGVQSHFRVGIGDSRGGGGRHGEE